MYPANVPATAKNQPRFGRKISATLDSSFFCGLDSSGCLGNVGIPARSLLERSIALWWLFPPAMIPGELYPTSLREVYNPVNSLFMKLTCHCHQVCRELRAGETPKLHLDAAESKPFVTASRATTLYIMLDQLFLSANRGRGECRLRTLSASMVRTGTHFSGVYTGLRLNLSSLTCLLSQPNMCGRCPAPTL